MTKLIKLLLVLPIYFTALNSLAQQDHLFTSEGVRSFWYNPATVATFNQFSVNSTSRVTFFDGIASPYTVHINSEYKLINLIPANPRNEFGIGLNYIKDVIAKQNTSLLNLALNYQFKFDRSRIVAAIQPGIQSVIFKGGWIAPGSVPDPILPPANVRQTEFDLSMGLNWYGERFAVGVSGTHFFTSYIKQKIFESATHYYINAMYRFKLPFNLNLKTLGTFRTVNGFSSIQALAFVELPKNNISIGGGYRNGDFLLMGASFRISKFYVGYFLDIVQGPLSNFGTKSHEIRIAFEIPDQSLFGPINVLNDTKR